MKVEQLIAAITHLEAADALPCKLTPEEWKEVAPYLAVRFLRVGEPLMSEGETDREFFILAEGELQVSIGDSQIASVGPGAVVGEGGFLSGQPRSATVTPTRPGVAWALHWDKFEAMSRKHPRLALQLLQGLATVMAVRMREALLVGHFA
jgi:CRP-like cAMP-binding protein